VQKFRRKSDSSSIRSKLTVVVVEDERPRVKVERHSRQQMEPPREGCVSITAVESQGMCFGAESTGSADFCAKKGCSGNKRAGTWKSTGYGPIDLSDESKPNELNIHYSSYGITENCLTDSLAEKSNVSLIPRYFTFGLNVRITVPNQLFLLGHVTGDVTRGLDERIRQRRQETWHGWYKCSKENGHTSFEKTDLPVIARRFAEYWEGRIPDTNEGRIDPPILDAVAKEIRALLEACSKVGRRTRRGGQALMDLTLNEKDDFVSPPPTQKRRRLNGDSTDTVVEPVAVVTPTRSIPPALKLDALRDLLKNDKLDELAAIEYAIELLYKKLEVTGVTAKFYQAGVSLPTSITLEVLHDLTNILQGVASRHLSTVRKELIIRMPGGLFSPKESDLLFEWLADGRRYEKGERLPAVNYEIHPDNNRLWLTDKAAHCIRHMLFCFKLPISRFPALWNCFAVLLLGRQLTQEEFSSAETIRLRCVRLHMIDSHRFAVDFKKYLTTPTNFGFHVLWYTVSDDSKHFNRDRHVCVISAQDQDETTDDTTPKPCFRFLTAGIAATKDSDGNSDLNVSAASD
jgi:hypothetical protein